ncbi:ubiquinone/menaquinone biosynthesis C-methylase UbiE [Saccharomonospora amisosensis]|uniref:Ubiquinone/menaquinone biosynthesis C-methylase UbiE n=1 Tax=Saccharomonospora amisosensis TaxID=1128677 RepID=A0A7X5ULF3_9PSEU|nr:class I SAM-dependent methyltransferase [Saccharomonospora amisosensis]NIJ10156.1 ubiquinone/menaquinone biosynthesis C-methylase UbiE [Saccharomonospora amisosensis]
MKPTTGVRILDQRTPAERDRSFLPGAGKSWLLPCYDAFARVVGVRALYERTVELAGVAPGQAVIDVGCGTGNLSLTLLRAQPRAQVTALDPDAAALHRAARKARRRGVALTLVQGYADRFPTADASADHVVSSLALHHIDDDGRTAFGREALRVLRPGGKVTIADFGGPSSNVEDYLPEHDHGHGLLRALRHLPRLMRSRVAHSPVVARNQGNGIVALLTAAGFEDAGEVAHADHRFGRVTFVQATRR